VRSKLCSDLRVSWSRRQTAVDAEIILGLDGNAAMELIL
jgi:hypothetical protein